MRVWDISPGHLNRQSLLGEHRELHGLYNILNEGKRGYSQHPETLRWVGALSGLALRHAQLAAEMRLRGYTDRTPLPLTSRRARWPAHFVTEPAEQFTLLGAKYSDKEPGRIPLPRDAQELWAQHKYSVMARDPERYRQIGRAAAKMRKHESVDELARELVLILRRRPTAARLVNALEHLWGHVRKFASPEDKRQAAESPTARLALIQSLALEHSEPFLLASTALGELSVWLAC
ncbi:MAG: DUF1722 domain-containing protein [Gammaproteobacteria bacterium]